MTRFPMNQNPPCKLCRKENVSICHGYCLEHYMVRLIEYCLEEYPITGRDVIEKLG